MSDTPIAERLAAELGSPWPLQWRITGWLYEDFEPDPLGSKVRLGGPDGAAPPGTGPHHLTFTEGLGLNEKQRQQMEDLIKHRVAQGDIDGAADMAVILDGAEKAPPPQDPPQ